MSNRSPMKFGARFLVLSLIFGFFGIFNTGSTLAAKNRSEATPTAVAQDAQGGSSQLTGQLIASGPVTVNGNKAITGTTIFTESNIVVDCAKGNSAIVDLGKLGRIELVAGTKFLLRFSEGLISGDLQDGKAQISTPADVKVDVNTPTGPVTATCTQECVTPVEVQGFTQCVPLPVVTTTVPVAVPQPIPVGGGIGPWGAIAAAGAVGAGIGIGSLDDDDDIVVPVVSDPSLTPSDSGDNVNNNF